MQVKVLEGQMVFKNLTNNLSQKNFVIIKASLWTQMLNEGKKPTKWLKPSNKGTKVNFTMIRSRKEYKESFEELETFLSEVNKKHDLELKIVWEETK